MMYDAKSIKLYIHQCTGDGTETDLWYVWIKLDSSVNSFNSIHL